jgi:2-polyprenyl-3-methyl-5-hydroxy-6-metoxy-1,4-benzoquinol methylase
MNQAERESIKQITKNVWGTNPAGWTHAPTQEKGTKDFFETVLAKRFLEECPWLPAVVNFENYKDKKVLEIGSGAGYDAYQFCKNGANYTGIDLVPENRVLAKKHLSFYGYKPRILEMDAEKMQLPEKFDLIYSFGVLHHIPHIELALTKSFDHLKDEGKVLFIVYNKHSIAYWLGVFLNWIIRGRFLYETLASSLGRVEQVGSLERPLVRVYTKKSFFDLLKKAGFIPVSTCIRKLERHDLPFFRALKYVYRFIPEFLLEKMGRLWGWYLCVEAVKKRAYKDSD